ncbi:MAG: hypothetical protein JNL28_00645 [Planctomycetes bacterium]|nr:hypothetical protein [Planctomycetota bacterium]
MVTARQRNFLLVLLLFVLPAILVIRILSTTTTHEVVDGAQPGGVVRGVVLGPDEKGVALVKVVAMDVAGTVVGAELAQAITQADGAFELTLPPVEGRYLLKFTGTELQPAQLELGWILPGGEQQAPGELRVAMRQGCGLDVEIVGPDKALVGAGRYQLTSLTSGGLLGGFTAARPVVAGKFDHGTFSVDGLAPERTRVEVRLENGDRVDAVLELAPGRNRHRVEL